MARVVLFPQNMSHAEPLRRPYLLVAEDDADLRSLLAGAFERVGYTVVECANGAELVEHLQPAIDGAIETDILAVVTDVRMPGVTGISILEGLHQLGVKIPTFMITAFGSPTLHRRAAQLGIVSSFDKPLDIEKLVGAVVDTVGIH
tara:strand:- start:89738 stop:90175 length:438 start_codon:yes stop_codon:yes gene_type:complete